MEKQRKILKSPSVKRRSRTVPVNQRVTLERVIGLTAASNATFACDANTGTIAYPAGCVVVLFNPRRTKQSHILNFSKKTLTAVAFSPDGKHIVTGESGHQPAVRVWNVEEKSQVSELHGHKFGINCVAFSPNLKYLVSIGSQHDMMVNVWNWKTGTKVASNKISSKVNAVAFSEDGSMFVTVGNRHVKFWYLDSSKSRINETVPLMGRSGIMGDQKNNYFCDVVFGKRSVSNCVFTITQAGLLCQFNEKRLLDKWVELRTTMSSCLSAGEDYIFIGCANGVVRVFDAHTLRYIATLPHPHYLGVDVASALSPSNMISRNEDVKYPDTLALVFDEVHRKVSCVYNDHSLYMWDVHDVKKVGKAWSFLYHSSCVWGLEVAQEKQASVLPPGSFITCSSDGTIRIWNIDPHMKPTASYKRNVYSNELLKILYVDPTMTSLRDVNYNPAGGTDKTDTKYGGKNGIRSVCISPTGCHLASGDRIGNVRIHDLETAEQLHTIEAHDGEVLCLEYSAFNTGPKLLSSTSRDRLVHVFDTEQKYGLLQTLDDHSSSITAVKFTDNDSQLKMLSCGADKSLLFRSAQMSPEFQFTLSQHLVSKTTLYDMDVDPTQKYVATACQDRNIRIHNIKTGKQKKSYKGSIGDDGTLIRLSLDPSGSFVATTCTDKNLCVLDFCTGELVATSYGHSELSTGIKFTNDLKNLISVSGDGCIFIWRLSGEMTRQMQGRLEGIGQLPVEAQDNKNMDKPINLESLEFKSPSKILQELTHENELRSPDKSLDYRFSVSELPKWAKPEGEIGKIKEGSTPKDDQDTFRPDSQWAQTKDNRKVLLAKLNNQKLHSGTNRNTRKYNAEYYDDTDGDHRRETMVLPKPQNTPRKIPVIIDDEDSGDDDDDDDDDDEEDFFPSFHKKRDDDSIWEESFKSRPSDQDTRNSWSTKRQTFNFNRTDSNDDLEELEPETPELIYYPPSEADSTETNGTSFTVFAGNNNALSKSKKSLSQSSGQEKSLDGDSESTDPISIEDIDDDDDLLSIPSNPTTPSEELAMKTPEREKFLKDTFENFSPIENFEKSLEDMEKNMNTSQTSDLLTHRLSISSRFLSRGQQSSIRNTSTSGELQRQDNWFDLILKEIFGYRLHACYRRLQSVQKRKDAMARAVDETRKRLLAMGWKDQSPEPEKPEVPDVKVIPEEDDVKEQTTPTDRAPSSTSSSSQSYQRPRTPTSLRRCWSTFDLPKTPIVEEKPRLTLSVSNPSTPLSKSPHGKTSSAIPKCSGNSASSATKNKPLWRSRIPTPTSVSSRHTSPRAASNRGSVWDTRSEGSDDSLHKTPTNRTSGTSPVPPPRGRKSRPSTLTLDKKKEVSDHDGRTTPKLVPRSHSHSSLHRKQTESSKAKVSKTNSSSNLLKEDKKDVPKTALSKCTSMQNISNSKLSLPKTKSKLSTSKLSSLYTSTPNLANAFPDDSEEIESSNLKFSGRLSGSVPDLLDEGSDKSSNKSEKSRTSSGKRSDSKRYSSGTKGESRISSSKAQRLSLPTGVTSVNINRTRKSGGLKKDDKDLMPPPVKGSVVKSKQEEFIKKAVQSKRKQPQTTSEMTLDMAKNILRGKSGILESEESSCDSSVNSSGIDLPAKTATVTTTNSYSSGTATFTSTFPAYTTASTTSVVYTVSSSVTSSTLSSATISSSIEPFLHNNANILKVAAEIESTVADMGHKSAFETAFQNLTVLDASPHDLPERDITPTQVTSSTEDSSVGQTSTVKSYCDDSKIGSDWRINKASHSSGIEGDEEVDLPPTASIKDRIALLTSHASPRISHHGTNTQRNSSATLTSYLSTTPTRTTHSSRGDVSSSVGIAGLSPRSSSGIGSSLDSEAATKLFTSPGSSLSPQSNCDLAHTETHNVSDSEDMSSKDSPKGVSQCLYTAEMEFTSSNSLSLADASSESHSVTSRSSPLLPLSAPNSAQLVPSRSSPVISSKSTLIGSPRSNATGSPRSNINSSPMTNGYHPSSQDNQGNLEIFVEALKDLRQAVEKVTVLYKQVQLGDDCSADKANKLLKEAVTETHETFANLVPKDRISSSTVQTPEGPVSMDVLEPVLSRYSEQLSDRVLEILSNRKGEIL